MNGQDTTKPTKRLNSAAIMELVYEWLRMIPKVNKFFLEQEAKIKTDKLLKYAETVESDAAVAANQPKSA